MIPVPLTPEGTGVGTIPADTVDVIRTVRVILAERARTARRWIKAICPDVDLSEYAVFELDKHHRHRIEDEWFAGALAGQPMGMMSEAGCPGVADPGARVVSRARDLGIPVQALVGPNSLILALMGSGLNGQSFAFQGYLSPRKPAVVDDLKRLEKLAKSTKQSQIFMETPYRNDVLLATALEVLEPDTWLAIASNLTAPDGWQETRTVKGWSKGERPVLGKVPSVFILGVRLG
ncbi:MAG: SAM-dependent methyltransferase [Saprospiraceae bacterium]